VPVLPRWLFPRTRSMVTPVLQRGGNKVQMGRTANERRSAQAHGLRRIQDAGGSLTSRTQEMSGGETMSPVTHDAPVSSKRLWMGRIISALPALLLLFSGTMKLLKVPAVIEGMAHYGYPEHLIVLIGMLEVGCTIVYLVPRTAVLGAILMTAYLGGATATNVRVGDSSFI